MFITSNSPHSAAFEAGSPATSHHATTEALKQSVKMANPIRFSRDNSAQLNGPKGAFGTTGYDLEPCDPTASEAVKIDIQPIARLKGSRAADACFDSKQKRCRVEVVNAVTGEPEKRTFRLITRRVTVVSYGVMFHFVKANRGQSVLDSRSGKRVTQAFCKAELCRILGVTNGVAKFAELVGA